MSIALRPALAAALIAVLTACGPGDGNIDNQPLEGEATLPMPSDNMDAMTPEQLLERARGIHERVITIDTHIDINTENFTLDNNYLADLDTQVTLPKMEAGGLDVAWFIVYTGQGELTEEGYERAYDNAMDKFNAIHRLTEEIAPDQIELALTSGDVRRIVDSGRKVAMIGVENGYPIGTDISRVEEFYDLGARYMSLAHNGHNQLADSNTGEADDEWLHGGLSELGRQVIAEMNRLGMMIDLSHPSREANIETMRLSQAPVIASHSSAHGMEPAASRNLTDEELLMLRDTGGVAQAVAFRSYIDADKHRLNQEAMRELRNEIAAEMRFELLDDETIDTLDEAARSRYEEQLARLEAAAMPRLQAEVHDIAPPVNVADFVDHIDYMVDLIGIDHVGIVSDFDGGGGVEGWMDASETFNVTLELVRRGYTEEQIAKLWGENLLRVLDEVQQVAASMQ